MDRGPAVGPTRLPWSRRAPAARHHHREASAASVEPAGQNQLKMYHMANTRKIRSKHNNLLNYFIHDKRYLSKAYVRSCEKFFKELKKKNVLSPKLL